MKDVNKIKEQLSLDIADFSPVMLWMAREDSLCVYFNQTWLEFTGRTLEQEWGVGWARQIHPEDFQKTMDGYIEAFNKRIRFELKYRLRRRDGLYRWILDRGIPSYIKGDFRGYVGSCIDITDMIESHQWLIESQNYNKAILQLIPMGIIVSDENGLIEQVNDSTTKQFGYTESEMVGMKIEELIPKKMRNHHPHYRNEYMKNAVPRIMGEGRHLFALKKDGSEFPVEIGLQPVILNSKKHIISTVIDITKRKQIEGELLQITSDLQQKTNELTKAYAALVETDKAKDEFITVITHELRTPLSAIMEAISLVVDGIDGPINDEQRDTLCIAQQNIERLSRLINNALDFQRMGSRELSMNFITSDIIECVARCISCIKFDIEAKNISLRTEFPDEVLDVECDPDRIDQVLYNICHNAIKYVDPGGTITITIQKDLDHCLIAISDTGVGISTKDHQKIFRMFEQSYEKGYWKPGGAGIGLAVCQKIIVAHQGKITVKNNPDKGCTFTIFLPCRQQKNLDHKNL